MACACRGLRGPRAGGAGVGRATGGAARAAGDCRHSDRFHPVRAHAARRRAVPHAHAARRRHRPGGDHDLQARVLAVRRGRGLRRASSRTWRTSGCCSPTCWACCSGFALLSKHFEASQVPAWLPRFLPDDWKGGFVLLVMIFVMSSFLDNIAAALIGGTIAAVVFRAQGAHRLPRRHRRGVERGRLRQRRRRHDDDDDVDRRRVAAVRARGLRRRRDWRS